MPKQSLLGQQLRYETFEPVHLLADGCLRSTTSVVLCRYVDRSAMVSGNLGGLDSERLCFALKSPDRMGRSISCSRPWNCSRGYRLWSLRPRCISCAIRSLGASCPRNRLRSGWLGAAIRAVRPAAVGLGGDGLLARVVAALVIPFAACGGR